MKKIIIFILSMILGFSTLFNVACQNQDASHTDDVIGEEQLFSTTEHFLVNSGVSSYKIVIPADASLTLTTAAEEMQLFINKSTNCILPIVKDIDVVNAQSGNYISIGQTSLLQDTDIVVDYSVLGDAAFIIKTIDDDVFLCGATKEGTLYSVYKFLEYQIGFKAYAVDCVKYGFYPSVKLMDFNYDYVPTVGIYTTAATEFRGTDMDTRINAMRMLMMPWGGEESYTLEEKEYSMFCHTLVNIISENVYKSSHPEWFSNGQICMTNPELIEEFTKNFINFYVLPYNSPYVMFGGWDNHGYCKCDKCQQDYALYGGPGGVFVRFMNTIADNTERYLEEKNIDKELRIVGMAYAGYEASPTTVDSKGNIVPVHESVMCDEEGPVKVGICLSPLNYCQSHAIDDPNCSTNLYYSQTMEGWGVLTEYLTFYTYTVNYTNPNYYHQDYYALGNLINALERYDTSWMYDAGKFRQPLNSMRLYVRRQITWDNTKNVDDLINEFLSEYYSVGAKYIREYFDALNHQSEVVYTLTGKTCVSCFGVTSGKKNWPLNVLRNFSSILENGMFAIKNSDMTESDKSIYYERIYREWVFVKVTEYVLYANNVDDETLKELEQIAQIARDVYDITKF